MTALIAALAFIGALWVLTFTLKVVLVLLIRRLRRKRSEEALTALYEAMERHPAGRGLTPIPILAACCGQQVYGDTLKDLFDNLQWHESTCPHVRGRAA